jgi:nifR3 family TIM-barrel protein
MYAPLAGCSDFPFRAMSRFAGHRGLIFCEMVKMDALIRRDPGTLEFLAFSQEMHPIGAQLCGSKPQIAGQAAKMVEELGFDLVDFNCGCPVDKVTKDGSGSGMLKHPDLIGEIIVNMVAATRLPVSVKIRAGWDASQINAEEIVEIAEKAGASMITIHGRTRSQGYRGFANRDVIRAAKKRARSIKVVGNGDIFCRTSAMHMFSYTQCDALLVSRGTLGQPWIWEDIERAMQGLPQTQRSARYPLSILLSHIDMIARYRNDKRACLDIRRVGCWYCKNTPHISSLRSNLAKVSSIDEAKELVTHFMQTLPES